MLQERVKQHFLLRIYLQQKLSPISAKITNEHKKNVFVVIKKWWAIDFCCRFSCNQNHSKKSTTKQSGVCNNKIVVEQHCFAVDSVPRKVINYVNKNHKRALQNYHVFATIKKWLSNIVLAVDSVPTKIRNEHNKIIMCLQQ